VRNGLKTRSEASEAAVCSTAALSGEKPLRKRGDEADLDDEPDEGLESGKPGDWILQTKTPREEPTPMEGGHAEDERAVWRQRFG
jgi:hypothetical protein